MIGWGCEFDMRKGEERQRLNKWMSAHKAANFLEGTGKCTTLHEAIKRIVEIRYAPAAPVAPAAPPPAAAPAARAAPAAPPVAVGPSRKRGSIVWR